MKRREFHKPRKFVLKKFKKVNNKKYVIILEVAKKIKKNHFQLRFTTRVPVALVNFPLSK